MAKFFLRTGSAIVGIVLAIVLYMNFGIFEIKTVFMYPALKPGQHVLIHKTSAEQIGIGDLVLFEAPFYDFDTQEGMLAVRRVSGIKTARCGWNVMHRRWRKMFWRWTKRALGER